MFRGQTRNGTLTNLHSSDIFTRRNTSIFRLEALQNHGSFPTILRICSLAIPRFKNTFFDYEGMHFISTRVSGTTMDIPINEPSRLNVLLLLVGIETISPDFLTIRVLRIHHPDARFLQRSWHSCLWFCFTLNRKGRPRKRSRGWLAPEGFQTSISQRPTLRRRFSPRDNEVSLIFQVLGYLFIEGACITVCRDDIFPLLLVCTPCYVSLPDVLDWSAIQGST